MKTAKSDGVLWRAAVVFVLLVVLVTNMAQASGDESLLGRLIDEIQGLFTGSGSSTTLVEAQAAGDTGSVPPDSTCDNNPKPDPPPPPPKP